MYIVGQHVSLKETVTTRELGLTQVMTIDGRVFKWGKLCLNSSTVLRMDVDKKGLDRTWSRNQTIGQYSV